MRQNNPVLSSALIVFSFWWVFFTLKDFVWSPFEVMRNWAYIGWSMRQWVMGLAIGGVGAAWFIWFKRTSIEDRLRKSSTGRMNSTLGGVPAPLAEPARVKDLKKRLPLNHPLVKDWMEKAKEDSPEHLALFMAVWDVYSSHRDWPASHRTGGHGGRRLWEHCLGVVVKALEMAPDWKYEGVHVKVRGRKPKLIIALSRPEFEFNAADPLIPILALAHDIGKLEAYHLQPDGSFSSREHGSTQSHDDGGVMHDALGARVLARLPEFWALPPSDRRILNLVIAHYHHPSEFPVDENGHSPDDRMTSLLEFLIVADRRTGMEESGMTADDEDNEITEDESKLLWDAFVSVVTEHGRINGIHGDSKTDKGFMIGSKHGQLIAIQEKELRMLLLSRLGQSMGEGDARYRITRNLLAILSEKGLLYDSHNGIDFARYAPMWTVSHRRTKDGAQICVWTPCIILKSTAGCKELDLLTSLAEKKARLRVENPLYTHNPNIRDPEALRELVRQAFGDKVADKLRVPKSGEPVVDEAEVQGAAPAAPAEAAAPAVAPASPEPASAKASTPAPAPAPAPARVEPTFEPTPVAAEPVAAATVPEIADPTLTEQEGDGMAPWDEPGMPNGVMAADLPDIEGDGLDGIEVDIGGDVGQVEAAGDSFGDFGDFGDFPSDVEAAPTPAPAPMPAPVAPPAPAPVPAPESHQMQSPRDAVLVASLHCEIQPGKAIKDVDAPKGRELGKSEKDKAAMAALRAFNQGDAGALAQAASRPKNAPTLQEVVAMLNSGKMEVFGPAEGCRWVFHSALRKAFGKRWAGSTARDLGLTIKKGPDGHDFVGVPESSA